MNRKVEKYLKATAVVVVGVTVCTVCPALLPVGKIATMAAAGKILNS